MCEATVVLHTPKATTLSSRTEFFYSVMLSILDVNIVTSISGGRPQCCYILLQPQHYLAGQNCSTVYYLVPYMWTVWQAFHVGGHCGATYFWSHNNAQQDRFFLQCTAYYLPCEHCDKHFMCEAIVVLHPPEATTLPSRTDLFYNVLFSSFHVNILTSISCVRP